MKFIVDNLWGIRQQWFRDIHSCTLQSQKGYQFRSVQLLSRVWLCNSMSCSVPGLPVHHQLWESTQTHVHWVGDAIQHLILCHPLLLLPSIFPSIRVFSNSPSSILGTYWPGEFIFQCPIFLPFHTVHGVLKARTLKWFTIPFSSGPHSGRCKPLGAPEQRSSRTQGQALEEESHAWDFGYKSTLKLGQGHNDGKGIWEHLSWASTVSILRTLQ